MDTNCIGKQGYEYFSSIKQTITYFEPFEFKILSKLFHPEDESLNTWGLENKKYMLDKNTWKFYYGYYHPKS